MPAEVLALELSDLVTTCTTKEKALRLWNHAKGSSTLLVALLDQVTKEEVSGVRCSHGLAVDDDEVTPRTRKRRKRQSAVRAEDNVRDVY